MSELCLIAAVSSVFQVPGLEGSRRRHRKQPGYLHARESSCTRLPFRNGIAPLSFSSDLTSTWAKALEGVESEGKGTRQSDSGHRCANLFLTISCQYFSHYSLIPHLNNDWRRDSFPPRTWRGENLFSGPRILWVISPLKQFIFFFFIFFFFFFSCLSVIYLLSFGFR